MNNKLHWKPEAFLRGLKIEFEMPKLFFYNCLVPHPNIESNAFPVMCDYASTGDQTRSVLPRVGNVLWILSSYSDCAKREITWCSCCIPSSIYGSAIKKIKGVFIYYWILETFLTSWSWMKWFSWPPGKDQLLNSEKQSHKKKSFGPR